MGRGLAIAASYGQHACALLGVDVAGAVGVRGGVVTVLFVVIAAAVAIFVDVGGVGVVAVTVVGIGGGGGIAILPGHPCISVARCKPREMFQHAPHSSSTPWPPIPSVRAHIST